MPDRQTDSSACSAFSAPRARALLDLLPGLRALTISKVTHDVARALASTASTALQAVLEARTNLKACNVIRALARTITRLRFSAAGNPPSSAELKLSQEDLTQHVHPLAPLKCAKQQHALQAGRLALSSCGSVRTLYIERSRVERIPTGMTALAELRLEYNRGMAGKWLTESSRAAVHMLTLRELGVSCVLVHMSALQQLDAASGAN